MDSIEVRRPTTGLFALPFYYGWVNLVVAAFAMVGTLPGRTQGLGLITEALLADLKIDRILFARINLWATLIGALFCIGVGKAIDRFGSRAVLTVVTTALGIVVLFMSAAKGVALVAVLITLTRGFGQSALSVISITIVGKWFVRRLNLAMAIYTILLSVGFMLAFPLIGAMVIEHGWRSTWSAVGLTLLVVLAPLSLLLVRRSPESCDLPPDGDRSLGERSGGETAGDTSAGAGNTGLLDLWHFKRTLWTNRLGYRAIQRIDSGGKGF